MERPSSRSARIPRGCLGWAISVSALVAAFASCRIYREPSRDDATAVGSGGQPATSGDESSAPEREATKPSAPAADALNLWVLSRPQGDLPTAAEPTPAAPAPAEAPKAPITAAVVLGLGAAPACAEAIARRAVDSLSAERAPLDVLSSALESARRWRWPDATRTLSATVKSSTGAFGGVQSAPAPAFGVALLRQSLERRAVLGGPGSRWRAAPSEPAAEPPCEPIPDTGLAGPVGVLLRNRDGAFFGGIVQLDPLADAGVVSMAAQYGVSLAVGPAGAVLMAADCEPPPLERVAESVYASENWVLATAELPPPGACRHGHALLSRERAWLAPATGLAAAIVEAAPSPPPAPAAAPGFASPASPGAALTAPPEGAPDAGLGPGSAAP